MTSIFPQIGVPASQAENAVNLPDENFKTGCVAKFYGNACNPRLDGPALNAIMSELLNIAFAYNPDFEWDCTRVDNLASIMNVQPYYSNTIIITSSQIYTPSSPAVRQIEVELVGGGGGGGGAKGQGAGTAGAATGGQGGGRTIKTINLAGLTADYQATIVIGAGGAGVHPDVSPAPNGGDTTFDDGTIFLDAVGGLGGESTTATSGTQMLHPPTGTGAGEPRQSTTGDINIPTTPAGDTIIVSGEVGNRSLGGASTYGSPGRPGLNANALNSSGFGAGGTGAAVRNENSDLTGGDGAPGFVIIKERG